MTTTPKRTKGELKAFTLGEIARLVQGELEGDPEIKISGVAGIEDAKEGDITLFDDSRYLPFLQKSTASAVVTRRDLEAKAKALVYVDNPSAALVKIIGAFCPPRLEPTGVIDPKCVLTEGCRLGAKATIGPHAVIEAGVAIGDRTVIGANAYVGKDTHIGHDCLIYPNVTLREGTVIGDRVIIHSGTVIGSDGFGYETVRGVHVKLPQIGNVEIEDDVEIGSNVCVDRARFGRTLIQKGAKIDNLVQVAHNVVIGPHSIVVSQAGISGSTKLGHHVVVAGQVGIVGHIEIGDEVVIGAGSGVTKSIPAKTIVLGGPARPIGEQKRIYALIGRLPELFKELSEIKKKIFSSK